MSRVLLLLANPVSTGAPAIAFAHAKELVRRGHEVHVVHGVAPPGLPDLRADLAALGCTVTALGQFRVRTGVRRFWQVLRIGRRWQPDLIVAAMSADRSIGVAIARLLHVPSLLVLQSRMDWTGQPFRRSRHRLYRWTVRHATRTLAVADQVAAQALGEFGADPSRLVVVPNGIDVAGWAAAVDSARAATEPGEAATTGAAAPVTIVTIGRLTAHKRQRLLVPALAALRDHPTPWRLLVIGDSLHDSAVRSEMVADIAAAGLDDRFEFLGWRRDVHALLAGADIAVHPSGLEGWPLSVIEEMAAGLPVVLSDGFDAPAGFENGRHGYRVPLDDVAAITAAIRQLLDAGDTRRCEMGAACRELCGPFDIAAAAGQAMDHAEELLTRAVTATR